MRCLTITLNAAIDATYVVSRLEHGGANRVIRKHAMPGGKGNNVARVLAGIGETVVATGFLGGQTGTFIERGLRAAGVDPRFTWLEDGESRRCHTILDQDTGVATEILEAGPCITQRDAEAFLNHLPDLVAGTDAVVISGSAPTGATPAFLARVAAIVREGSTRMVIDSSGPTLESLLPGRPDLLKPNAAEMALLMGQSAPLQEQVAFVQRKLIPIRMAPGGRVLLSRGADGALLVTGSAAWLARAPAVEVVNTVGYGDALLAGFVAAWQAGTDDAVALRDAVATGTAAALQEVAGVVDASDVERLRSGVEVIEYGLA
jgi:tagatose 6-phosphate kinase